MILEISGSKNTFRELKVKVGDEFIDEIVKYIHCRLQVSLRSALPQLIWRLDLFLPKDKDGPKHVIIFVTGGAWMIGLLRNPKERPCLSDQSLFWFIRNVNKHDLYYKQMLTCIPTLYSG
ncbi:unnamed protein product [Lactuca virosa]|uniref:Uncharacterized protein n=1 Tax=Lactuca virosa TaxID=75947 RepID=A0AAU9NTP9_9ASTR|nr:unnamed protein product [Lactuca virosa]